MMTQTAAEGEPHFVNTMLEHTRMCGQMARAFGNDRFDAPSPYTEVVFMVENHDRGWDDYDRNPGIDPKTHLPFIMARTPTPDAVKTNRGSPDFNEAHDAYCGLLSSMHSVGLYNGRYGLSRFVVGAPSRTAPDAPNPDRALIDAMLAHEEARQVRLKATLSAAEPTRRWVAERHLFQNYKQLQFFDTLSLYFHLRHADRRGDEIYIHVPMNADEDATVTLKKINDRVYSLEPYPFAADRLTLVCHGRYVKPFPATFDLARVGDALSALPLDQQTYEIVPA